MDHQEKGGDSSSSSRRMMALSADSLPTSSSSDEPSTAKPKKKLRPLSNIFSNIASKQKEAAGMRRYNKLQKQAKNSPSNSTDRIVEETEEPAVRRSMDFRGFFKHEGGATSTSSLPGVTVTMERETGGMFGKKRSPKDDVPKVMVREEEEREATVVETYEREEAVKPGFEDRDGVKPGLAPLDAFRNGHVIRPRTSMASLFTIGDKADRSSDDDSGSSGSRPPDSFLERDSDSDQPEEDIDALIKEKFSQLEISRLKDSEVPKPIDAITPVHITLSLPPRPSSPGVDHLEPDPNAPIKSAPSPLEDSTPDVLLSLPPRPSSPGVDDLDSPSSLIRRQTSSPIPPSSSPEPLLTLNALVGSIRTRALSSSASILSATSTTSATSNPPLDPAQQAAAAAAQAAADLAARERLASLARRSELSVAARLSGVVSRHATITQDTKKPSPSPTVSNAASKFFGSLFGDRPASPSSSPSLQRTGSLSGVHTSTGVSMNDRAATVGGIASKSRLEELMGMLKVEVEDEDKVLPTEVDEEDLIAAEEVMRVREAFEAEERRRLEQPSPTFSVKFDEEILTPLGDATSTTSLVEASSTSLVTSTPSLVKATSRSSLVKATSIIEATSTSSVAFEPGPRVAPLLSDDPVAKAAREASQAAVLLASHVPGLGMGAGTGGNDSIEAMLSKLESVYAAVSINSQTETGASEAVVKTG